MVEIKHIPRIGIATNWQYPDYGGMIQAFATQLAVESLGCIAEVLDAENLQGDINSRKMKYFLRNITDLSVVREKGAVVMSSLRRRIPGEYGENMRARRAAFAAFKKENFKPSRRFSDWDEIAEGARAYDCVLVGSDQLWLPSNITGDYYTLSFVPDDVRVVNYATSFGVPAIPEYLQLQTKRFLERFDALSARETSGQEIICKLTGRAVPLVCDPTLLIDAEVWSGVAMGSEQLSEPYIFCYLMGDNPYQRDFVRELKKFTGWRIVQFPHLDRYIKSDEGFADRCVYDADPAEFLGLIENASLVCTDSFHGTIFSSIFNTPFFVFPRFTKKATLSTNTRIESLLDRLSLRNRFVRQGDAVSECLERAIDFDVLNESIREFRGESLDYLASALGVVR
ncbi:polysaccharide pyruvyl transferase family protein [Arabiibacter massiliensis]|uniref:polysaccharide pyruvyl transferase family protein n=1 Tax=Arabiibacter massiliensis TaxID=1870985 RepID=UPI0009BA09B0|nr:polysaccharide pyruvyl transferase family protein [Arabiibacter massiliensis]